jgi:hypothetical protein
MVNKILPIRGNLSFEELKKVNEHGAEYMERTGTSASTWLQPVAAV